MSKSQRPRLQLQGGEHELAVRRVSCGLSLYLEKVLLVLCRLGFLCQSWSSQGTKKGRGRWGGIVKVEGHRSLLAGLSKSMSRRCKIPEPIGHVQAHTAAGIPQLAAWVLVADQHLLT